MRLQGGLFFLSVYPDRGKDEYLFLLGLSCNTFRPFPYILPGPAPKEQRK
jgi:hypothetical protein